MRLTIVAGIALLAACGKSPIPRQSAPATFPITVHWHESATAMHLAGSEFGVPPEADGFAVMTTNPNGVAGYRCDIHLVQLPDLSSSSQELLGHEFAHCLFGDWH